MHEWWCGLYLWANKRVRERERERGKRIEKWRSDECIVFVFHFSLNIIQLATYALDRKSTTLVAQTACLQVATIRLHYLPITCNQWV